MCSAEKCENVLVETAIFAIIGVLFCVTQKAFNFIEIKKQEHRETFQKTFYSPMLYFFLDVVVGSVHV